MKLFFRWAHLTQSPAVPGPNGVCGLSLSGTGMAFAGDPRFGPLAIPLRKAWLASGRLCRRPSGGRMFEAAVLHLLSADNSAGLAGHVKHRPQSPPRRDGQHSWCPAAPRQLEVEGEAARSVSWSGAGGQRPTMWVFFG